MNRKFEVAFMPKVKKAIHVKVKDVIDDLRNYGYDKALSNLSIQVGNETMAMTIKNLYRVVGTAHARSTYSRLLQDQKKGFGFNTEWTNWILQYLQQFLLEKITFRIAETTREALMKTLAAGITAGMGIDGMIAQLEDWPFERYQAARIVRTEVNRASNVGALAQAQTGEYEQQKEWISVQDFRTRGHNPNDHANHVALNGTVIDENEDFVDPRNKDRLQFPGDPNGKAESTINCRCQAAFVNKRDSKGNLIPKIKSGVFVINRPKEEILLIEEKAIDFSEVILHTEKSVNDLKQVIEQSKFNPDEILEKVNSFEERIADVSTEIMEKNYDVRGDLNETKNHLAKIISEKRLEDEKGIDDLINLINSKDYTPEIKLQSDNGAIIAIVNQLREDFITALQQLKAELTRKKTWVHSIERDKTELIKTITSESI